MRTSFPSGKRRARASRKTPWLVGGIAAVLLAACSNTTASSNNSNSVASGEMITAASVDQTALSATIKKAMLDDVSASELDPVVADALAVASQPLTPEQSQL